MLRTGLARKKHQLLGTDAVRVDIDHQLQASAFQLIQAEVGYFNVGRLFGRKCDPHTGQILPRLLLGPIKLFFTDHVYLLLLFEQNNTVKRDVLQYQAVQAI